MITHLKVTVPSFIILVIVITSGIVCFELHCMNRPLYEPLSILGVVSLVQEVERVDL
jgi:hypothetical protein